MLLMRLSAAFRAMAYLSPDLAWLGSDLSGLGWLGLAWPSLPELGLGLHGLTWLGVACPGLAGVAWLGFDWPALAWLCLAQTD